MTIEKLIFVLKERHHNASEGHEECIAAENWDLAHYLEGVIEAYGDTLEILEGVEKWEIEGTA